MTIDRNQIQYGEIESTRHLKIKVEALEEKFEKIRNMLEKIRNMLEDELRDSYKERD